MSNVEKPSIPAGPERADELRALWAEGEASGLSERYRTADEISAEGRRRLAESE